MSTPSELREQLDKDTAIIASMLIHSPAGILLMTKLDAEFDAEELFNPDTHVTAYNLGRRDVVRYLHQIINYNRKKSDEIQNETGTI